MKAIILPQARADLQSIREARAEWSEDSARELVFAVLRRLRQIRDFPRSRRVIPEYQVEYLREMLEQGYRIMYEVFPDRIEVFAVASSRHDLRPRG